MQKVLLTLVIIFVIMFGLGLSFMEYKMSSPTVNLIMVIVGGLGILITGMKFCKKNSRRKHNYN